MSRFGISSASLSALIFGFCVVASAQDFRDEFDGNTLNSRWNVATNYSFPGNAADFRLTPTIADGKATLAFSTYNPTPSDGEKKFLGTEIFTSQAFDRGVAGRRFEARIRMGANVPAGLVGGFFLYTPPSTFADEIDFELLTKQIVANPSNNPILTTSWNDWQAPGATLRDGVHHQDNTTLPSFLAGVPGLDLTQFNTFTIAWLPDRIDWLINGNLISSWSDALPDAPMTVRLNFWRPRPRNFFRRRSTQVWSEPCCTGSTYTMEVDYVEVAAIPEPTVWAGVFACGVCAYAVIRRRRANMIA
ncbi:MAG: glycoside hydrolase family 16 protein [Pirellulales bacterium]